MWNHLALYVNVTFRGTSTSSSGRGVTPIVLTFAVITCCELEGRRRSGRERGERSVPVCVCVCVCMYTCLTLALYKLSYSKMEDERN